MISHPGQFQSTLSVCTAHKKLQPKRPLKFFVKTYWKIPKWKWTQWKHFSRLFFWLSALEVRASSLDVGCRYWFMPLLVFKKYSYSLTRGTYLTFREKKLCEKFPSLLTLSIERDSWTEHSAVEYVKIGEGPYFWRWHDQEGHRPVFQSLTVTKPVIT